MVEIRLASPDGDSVQLLESVTAAIAASSTEEKKPRGSRE
jgi:hypothetical protein